MFEIETTNLTKTFGSLVAVNNLNLQIRKGTIFGFPGPNGAGKSTTVKMLTGLSRPTAGEALISGLSILTHRSKSKRILACCLRSWRHAFKLHFFQFSSSNGLLVEAIAGIMFGSLPGIVAIYSLQSAGLGPVWQIALIFLVSSSFYCVAVLRYGNKFLQRQEIIANALS